MSGVSDWQSVSVARQFVRDHISDTDGITCPCCGQYAKLYRRKLTAPTARVLIAMYREERDGWVHLPTMAETEKGGDAIKARYWGLIEPAQGAREDGSTRLGWWRLTPIGVEFVNGTRQILKYVQIYNGERVRLRIRVEDPEMVSIREVLGQAFNYEELMGS